MKLTRQGIGVADQDPLNRPITDSTGSGMLPIQAEVSGTVTFKVLAKATSEAPWREIIAAGSVGFLQSIAWVPFIRLEVTAGDGTATLYLGEK